MQSFLFGLFLLLTSSTLVAQSKIDYLSNEELQTYIGEIESEFDFINLERKQELAKIVNYIIEQKKANQPIKLTFLSKDNTYRSQLSQIWLIVAAQYYQIGGINAFSAGYTPKQFSPKIVGALKRTGLLVEKLKGNQNDTYKISISKRSTPTLAFSKTYSNRLNPTKNYLAVFVNEVGSANHSFLANGAVKTIQLPYLTPVDFKKKETDRLAHDEQCRLFAKEMFYIIYSARQQLF